MQILPFGQSIKHGQLLENPTLPVSLHLYGIIYTRSIFFFLKKQEGRD